MNYHISSNNRAISDEFAWQPMSTCPSNVEVQLLTKYGVAVRGRIVEATQEYLGWLPFPNTSLIDKDL